jgi:hypothetical protein
MFAPSLHKLSEILPRKEKREEKERLPQYYCTMTNSSPPEYGNFFLDL